MNVKVFFLMNNETIIQFGFILVPDPDLEIRGAGGSSRPLDKVGGGVSNKIVSYVRTHGITDFSRHGCGPWKLL